MHILKEWNVMFSASKIIIRSLPLQWKESRKLLIQNIKKGTLFGLYFTQRKRPSLQWLDPIRTLNIWTGSFTSAQKSSPPVTRRSRGGRGSVTGSLDCIAFFLLCPYKGKKEKKGSCHQDVRTVTHAVQLGTADLNIASELHDYRVATYPILMNC